MRLRNEPFSMYTPAFANALQSPFSMLEWNSQTSTCLKLSQPPTLHENPQYSNNFALASAVKLRDSLPPSMCCPARCVARTLAMTHRRFSQGPAAKASRLLPLLEAGTPHNGWRHGIRLWPKYIKPRPGLCFRQRLLQPESL